MITKLSAVALIVLFPLAFLIILAAKKGVDRDLMTKNSGKFKCGLFFLAFCRPNRKLMHSLMRGLEV